MGMAKSLGDVMEFEKGGFLRGHYSEYTPEELLLHSAKYKEASDGGAHRHRRD